MEIKPSIVSSIEKLNREKLGHLIVDEKNRIGKLLTDALEPQSPLHGQLDRIRQKHDALRQMYNTYLDCML